MVSLSGTRCADVTSLGRYGRFVVSAIGRPIDELSWEGNARKYRGGGRGSTRPGVWAYRR
jgi:hypothetical protein